MPTIETAVGRRRRRRRNGRCAASRLIEVDIVELMILPKKKLTM
jgi:hypothetical protein